MMFLSVASGFAWLVALAGNIAFLVITLTVVRRHRPDAAGPFVAWSVASLAYTVLHALLSAIVPFLVTRSAGVEATVTVQGLLTVLHAVVAAGLVGLLAYAIVRLAQPPKPVPVPNQPPYR